MDKSPNPQICEIKPNISTLPIQAKHSQISRELSQQNPIRKKQSEYEQKYMSQVNIDKKGRSQPNLSKSQSADMQKQKIKFGRQEKLILYLHPSLETLKRQKQLDEKNVQIKYVNTLKKIKQKSQYLGCKVKVQGKGFTLENTKQKQCQQQQISKYKFGKEFNRNLRRKLLSRLDNCTKNSQSLHNRIDKGVEEMQDAIKKNQNKSSTYEDFTSKRMQTYLKSVSTEKLKIPYFSKKKLEKTFEKIKLSQQLPHTPTSTRKFSNFGPQKDHEEFHLDSPMNQAGKTTTSEKWVQLISEFAQDIAQFSQICDFFEKIQHQLLRYMPNNHLSNKINLIISQVEHGKAIRKIYNQCNDDTSVITPQKIIKFLKEEEGILSSMNYIVNIIKLNISAQRRKRFWDVQKTISNYQSLTTKTANAISDRLKTIQNAQIKKNISETVKRTNTSCQGLDPVYLQFVKQAQQQQFSAINSVKNRNIICEILKFQSLIK